MFEYLAVRLEGKRTALSKELSERTQGRTEELSELLDLFSPIKPTTE